MLRKIKIDYDLGFFLPPNQDYSIHKGTCLTHQVKELTDIHEEFGLGETYTLENTTIRQLWYDNNTVDFKELGHQLNIEVVTISSILQPPGNTIALHRDTFFQINKRFPNDTRPKVRANIFLEDWKVGHMIQFQDINNLNTWTTADNWKAGEGYLWSSKPLHLSCNAGMKDKFTLQVSGFYLN